MTSLDVGDYIVLATLHCRRQYGNVIFSTYICTSPDMCHGKKLRSKILKVPHQVYNSGSWVPKVPRQVYI